MREVTSLVLKVVGVGAAFAVVAGAQATDTITWTGTDTPNQSVTVAYDGNSKDFSVGTVAGFIQFDVTGGQNGLTNPFEAVCGDVFDDIGEGEQYLDTVLTSPFTGASNSPYTTDASVIAAGNIVGNVFDSAWADRGNSDADQQAAGLQISVWAAMYDFTSTVTDKASFINMLTAGNSNSGYLTISGQALGDSVTMADAYADWLTQNTMPGAGDTTLFLKAGASNNGGVYDGADGQDQWTESSSYIPSGSPEPFTMGIGLAGIGFAVRRRIKRSR